MPWFVSSRTTNQNMVCGDTNHGLETLPFAKILDNPNAITKKAINDARNGKTRKAGSLKQLFTGLKK